MATGFPWHVSTAVPWQTRLDGIAVVTRHGTAVATKLTLRWLRSLPAFTRRKPEEGIAFLRKAAEVDKPRLRRVLDRDNVVRVLEREGCTNLVRELEQLIAPPKK